MPTSAAKASTTALPMSNTLRIRPSFAAIVAFLGLTLLLVEAHEQIHALTTRVLCGGWAGRVFDNVLPYAGCGATRLALVDLAAPLFSYLCIWLGAALTWRASPRLQGFGFALLFASLPLGRLLPQFLTAFVAGSTADEYSFFRRLGGAALDRGTAGGLVIALALVLTVPPLTAVWRRLRPQRRARLFAAFYVLPLLFVIAWLMVGMNSLLADGVLAAAGTAGWPGLIVVHTALVGALLLVLRKHLADLLVDDGAAPNPDRGARDPAACGSGQASLMETIR